MQSLLYDLVVIGSLPIFLLNRKSVESLMFLPNPPKEPRDPEAIRKYCGRTSVSGRESSNRS